jgi:hypothetical protein
VYAGAYVFGRTTQRTRIVDGRARKTTGHTKPMTSWNVLIRDHHPDLPAEKWTRGYAASASACCGVMYPMAEWIRARL